MKLLIADDDRVLVHMLSGRLRPKGVNVSVAYDAMQAWMMTVRTDPDVILLDIQMPGGTGMEVLRKLKMSAKTSHIPVIVLSGSIDAQAGETVKELGADEYLTKPPDFDRLWQLLCRLLGIPQPSESGSHGG